MSLEAFNSLTMVLHPFIAVDIIRSRSNTTEPLYPKLVMAIGLRWLAGGSFLDLKISYGCSRACIFRCRDLFINAVNLCEQLKIKFPETAEEFEATRKGFKAKSSHGIMRGCVGAIDGLLATIKCPSMADSEGNPRSYYSGHYNEHGLNVQAVCDARCRFIFFSVAAPGKTPDQLAFERTSLFQVVQKLPLGLYIVADAAYTLTDQILVPYTGSQRENPEKDAYNFFLSQLRIRIEMSFGLLTTKFRILRSPLQTKLAMSASVFEACARLHNFVINNDWEDEDFEDMDETDMEIVALPNSPNGQWGYLPTVEDLVPVGGTSQIRDAVVEYVSMNAFRRPAHNEERRRTELFDNGLM
jgi:hypothetical protein